MPRQVNRARCNEPPLQRVPPHAASRLLFEPFREASLHLGMLDSFASVQFFLASRDLIEEIHLVLYLLETDTFRQAIEHLANFFFRRVHRPYVTPRIRRVEWRAGSRSGRSHRRRR